MLTPGVTYRRTGHSKPKRNERRNRRDRESGTSFSFVLQCFAECEAAIVLLPGTKSLNYWLNRLKRNSEFGQNAGGIGELATVAHSLDR